VDGRIEAGFRSAFGRLLSLAPPAAAPDVEAYIRGGLARAERDGVSAARGLAAEYARALGHTRATGSPRAPWSRFDASHPPRFLHDPSLAGLARWLRAAGYEAAPAPGVPGHRLPDEALRRGDVLLTTETEVLDRRIVVDGSLAVAWVPSALTMAEQLHLVALELGLTLREPRCMACGGALLPTPKEDVRERIPPRTALWKNEYFVCAGCRRLFWRGTHWERIEATLRRAVAA
jgi:uncharacterized protein with PIN domain